MKNQDNIPKARAKNMMRQSSFSLQISELSHLSQISLSEISEIKGGFRMEDGSFFGDLNRYLLGKINPITGKPSEIRFGYIDNYPYKPKP